MAERDPEPSEVPGPEEKWKANQDKVAFMKKFPGLTMSWDQLQGKRIEAVTALPSKAGAAVLVCSDGSFVIAPPVAPEPWELGEGLGAARPLLEPRRSVAWRR